MQIRKLALAALALAAAATPAAAKFVRFPASGNPAWEVHLPEDWTVKKGQNQNLLAFSADTRVRVVVQVLPGGSSLDEFATAALKVAHAAPWTTKRPITVSGFKGFDYPTTLGNSHGNKFNADMMVLRIDAQHLAICDLLVDASAPASELNAGRQIVAAMKIVH